MNRRELFRISTGALVALSGSQAAPATLDLAMVKRAPGRVVPMDPNAGGIELRRDWKDGFCTSKVINHADHAIRIREVALFSLPHNLPPDTRLYGESFQMLSQTSGTLGKPVDLGYSEVKHYKIPQPEGVTAVTGVLTLSPPGQHSLLFGFTSCNRFVGRFHVREQAIDAILDTEGRELAPGETWELEEFQFAAGPVRAALLDRLATRINRHHPPLRWTSPPTGWCSWYCFGPRVTATQVLENLDVIAKSVPALKYVQIDDGYQPAMGDWLETGTSFGGDVLGVLARIRERGFQPAIWVAPFIAEAKSHVFQQHPDWFIRDADGHPLPADRVTFGGWRHGPWYALDGTHPEVQRHFESLFHTMRQEWGCTYFKLDANFWGAMHGGYFHDPKATRIEAYRRGMRAILRGAGDSFILGCNHPIWPSFGLIHGSRSSADIKRAWTTFEHVARQNLSRNWQNGKLWWNDPDAVVLTGNLPDDEFQFHATAVYASGGMVLSGDDLTKMPPDRMAMLRKLLPPTGVAAEFVDDSLRVGVVKLADRQMVCMFNWDAVPSSASVRLPREVHVRDYWSGEDWGVRKDELFIKDMAPHSARLFVCE